MQTASNNLFLRLHKWAWRQDENFLTESFSYLLQHLLENEPEAAVGLLELLTGSFFKLRPEEAKIVVVRPQIVFTEGRPDLQIRTSRQLAYIEVKSESEADPKQLKLYRQLLKDSGIGSTQLVLLTRYPALLRETDKQDTVFVRWYQLADWIEQLAARYPFKPVSDFLVRQFLDSLRAKNMIMGQVTWELTGGVRALRTFADMLYEAATACGVKAQVWGNRDSIGVYLENRAYWAGILFSNPEILMFSTEKRKVNKEKAEELGVGTVHPWDNAAGYWWQHELDLQSEEAHFFARPKPSQMQFLERFLQECLTLVKRAEIPDSGLEPEPPSGDEEDDSLHTAN